MPGVLVDVAISEHLDQPCSSRRRKANPKKKSQYICMCDIFMYDMYLWSAYLFMAGGVVPR